ncbi:ATP-dependent DNA ligase [Psychromonas marina]|uniref:ATP-dependent DNA ligase n=1 Tax=Psychromonas marina TaxID=88364 RepID=A0ABQ6DXN2_9GAMM|nr:DNA ligase [Psychromonas marina]GLS89845.1 ATP-dependent DNA ligase [Psychromonas marina]
MPFLLLFILFIAPLAHSTPPPIQLASKFHDDINIEHYWVSEKLDGVRGYWDGKQLISKQGNPFAAPPWFTKDFPEQPLDGELWISRSAFEEVSGITRTQQGGSNAWKKVSFMIFDLPSSTEKFTQRVIKMQKLVADTPSPYLKMIPQQKIATHQALQKKLDEVIAGGGEGLMLHHINAYYQVKRSLDLMKLKRYDDAEAVVLEHLAGKGKHYGRMGALVVKTTEGIVFKIGTGFSNAERENPPNIGDTITYQYIGKTKNGVPRFASYLRIRYKLE